MRLKKQIAITMAVLIILMPIALAQTTASLELLKWSGEDNINGYARSDDMMTIQAKARIPEEPTISPDQLKFWIGSLWQEFDTCTRDTQETEPNYYLCAYTSAIDTPTLTEQIEFNVTLEDEGNNKRKMLGNLIILDSLEPVVTKLEVEPPMTTGLVRFIYEAEDYGTTEGTAEKCSGIKEIIFYVNNQEVKSVTGLKGQCEISGEIPYQYTGEEIQARVCAVAEDYLEQKSEPKCFDFVKDSGPPTISEIAIVNAEGAVMTHVKTGTPTSVRVRAEITDESTIANAKADLTSLGGGANENFDSISGDYYYWDGFQIDDESSGRITVTAEDIIGETKTESFDYDIKTDTKPPVKISASSLTEDDEGRPLLTCNSYLTITFSEKDSEDNPGVGMNLQKAYLNMQGLGESNVQADLCENIQGSTWECKWQILPENPFETDDGIYMFTLKSNTQDDLGNAIGGAGESFEVTYQSGGPINPEVIEYNVIPGPLGVGGEAVIEDTVQFKVRSKNFETAAADFSEIGGESSKDALICETDTVTQADVCTFEETVQVSGPAEARIDFKFTDMFGSESETEYNITIYEIDADTDKEYWRHTIDCMPQPIDRKTTSQIPQTVVCEIELNTSTGNIKPVNIIGPASVNDCFGNTTGFIDEIRTLNTVSGSQHPYLMIKLPARDYYLDNLSFQCPLTIYSKNTQTQQIISQPQEKIVDIELKFYDLPLGELYKKREKQIKNAIDSARLLKSGILETMTDIVNIAEEVCNWKNAITSALASIAGVVSALGIAEDTTSTIPGIGPALSQSIYLVRSPLCKTQSSLDKAYVGDGIPTEIPEETFPLYNYLDKACQIMNCQLSGGKDQWGIENLVGGAAPWCIEFEDWAMKESGDLGAAMRIMRGEGKTVGESEQTMRLYSNIKENIYLSTACLCLPGIVKGINKIAQIQCKYATCLEKDWKETGVPISYCQDTEHYLNCAYVWGGPLFDIIPFSSFFESISQMLGEMIANPVTILTTLIGASCEGGCFKKPAWQWHACAFLRVASEVGEAWGSIKGMAEAEESTGMTTNEWCSEMEKWAKDYDKAAATAGGGTDYDPL